jgi:hypothetical protein
VSGLAKDLPAHLYFMDVPDRLLLIVHVDNVGGRAVDLNGKTGGDSRAGSIGEYVFPLQATLPAGPWLATVTMQGGLDVATARATVLFASPVTRSWTNGATPAGGAAMLVLLGIATVIGIRLRRVRRAWA